MVAQSHLRQLVLSHRHDRLALPCRRLFINDELRQAAQALAGLLVGVVLVQHGDVGAQRIHGGHRRAGGRILEPRQVFPKVGSFLYLARQQITDDQVEADLIELLDRSLAVGQREGLLKGLDEIGQVLLALAFRQVFLVHPAHLDLALEVAFAEILQLSDGPVAQALHADLHT